jgi:hypothetical protein
MLPDYPGVKRDMSSRLKDYFEAQVGRHWGLFNEVRRVRYFEGDTHSLTREDGEVEKRPFTTIASEVTIEAGELPKLSLESALEKLDTAAADMARQNAQLFYGTISEAVEKVGNVVNAEGRRISASMILEMYEKLQIDFDRHGRPNLQQIHMPPELGERAEEALRELFNNPEMRRQFEALINAKREEWRAREARRKLVG